MFFIFPPEYLLPQFLNIEAQFQFLVNVILFTIQRLV